MSKRKITLIRAGKCPKRPAISAVGQNQKNPLNRFNDFPRISPFYILNFQKVTREFSRKVKPTIPTKRPSV